MPKRRAKRVNPRNKPVPKKRFDRAAIIQEASYGNLYYGWLLVIHTMLEQGAKTPEELKNIWNAEDQVRITDSLKTWQIRDAEKIMGLKEPYPNLELHKARSEVEIEAFRRKAEKRALHTALSSIALGLDSTSLFDPEQLRQIFSNVALTLAEIESGCNSYKQLEEDVFRRGLVINQTDVDIFLETTEEN